MYTQHELCYLQIMLNCWKMKFALENWNIIDMKSFSGCLFTSKSSLIFLFMVLNQLYLLISLLVPKSREIFLDFKNTLKPFIL